MIPLRIRKATRHLGAPIGWKPEEQGECGHLAIRDEVSQAGHTMISAWEPTPEEIERINAGQPIMMLICGRVHPPVMLSVGDWCADVG